MDRELRTQARLSKRTLTTQADIGNTVYGTEVHSVNGKTGHVVLDAEDVGALSSDTVIPSLDGYATEEWVREQGYLTEHQDISGKADKATTLAGYGIENAYTKTEVDALVDGQTAPVSSVNGKTGAVTITAQELGALTEHQDVSGKADKSEIPTKTSELTNDSGFLTQHQDLTPYALKSEIPVVPTNVSAFTNDVGYLTQHQDLSAYALKSTVYTKTQVDTALEAKADASDVLTPLIGDADNITPRQVMDCLEEGRNVSVSKEFEFSGVNFNLTFTAWNRVTDIPYEGQYADLVISNTIAVFGEGYYLFEMLGGKYNNGTMPWQIVSTQITTPQDLSDYALKSEIPTVTNDFTDAYKGKVDSLWDDYQDAITALG